ncbi:sulfurtransferase [Desulfurella sp.]|uniref:sulfurtransferase n=1 Tax=Desulfurella sp. TaxID=1962857 RepID=UPI003D133D17
MLKRILLIVSILTLAGFNLALAKVGILSTSEVASMIGKKNVVIVDARDYKFYLESHVKGAISLPSTGDLFAMRFPGVKARSIASNTQIEIALSKLGIKPDDTVIVYAGGKKAAFFLTNATRVMLALYWAGVKNVYYMNGGYQKWVDEKRPIQKTETKLPPTHFVIKHNNTNAYCFSNFVIWAVNNLNKIQIVDARPLDQYTGALISDKRLAKHGHIKGAIDFPASNYMEKVDNYYILKPKTQIEEMFKKDGINLNKPIISYCNTARLGSGLWFVANALFNDKLVWVYNGSMVSASRNPEIPIVKGNKPL